MRKRIIISILFLFCFQAVGHSKMAFVANKKGNWDLFVADDNGQNPIQLTETEYDEKDPSWSYDREKIVFAASDGQLRTINMDSQKVHTIAETTLNTPKISPCFSPDGKEIIFAQFRPPEAGDDTDLLILNIESNEIRRFIDLFRLQMWPVWSPDGKRIVYSNIHCSVTCGRLI